MNLGDFNGLAAPGRVIRPLPTGVGHGSSRPPGQADEIALSRSDGLVRWDPRLLSWRSLQLASVNSGTRGESMQRWKYALGRVRQGLGDARIVCDGDSTTQGIGTTSNDRQRGWPKILCDILNDAGVPATHASFWSNASAGSGTDTRVVLGSGWTSGTGAPATGFRGAVGGAGTLDLTPTEEFDRITVYYCPVSVFASGTSSVSVDGGGSLGTFTTNGTGTWTSATFNCTLGTHTVNITCPATGSNWAAIGGVECWRSDLSQVRVANMGYSGNTLHAAWASGEFDLYASEAYKKLGFFTDTDTAPDLTIMCFGINDVNNALPVDGFRRLMRDVLDRALLANARSALLIAPPQAEGTSYQMSTLATWAPYRSAIWEMGVATIDMMDRWGTGTQAVANGLHSGVHPTDYGYGDWAQAVANVLLS